MGGWKFESLQMIVNSLEWLQGETAIDQCDEEMRRKNGEQVYRFKKHSVGFL